MKYLLIILTFLTLGLSYKIDRPDYFDSKLNDIASRFKHNITNPDECQKLKDEVDYLTSDIEKTLNTEDNYTKEEKNQLIKLKTDAKALFNYIAVLSNSDATCHISIEDFNSANERVGGSVLNLVKDKYCLDIISVSFNGFTAHFAVNKSSKGCTFKIKWKTANGMQSGSVKTGTSQHELCRFHKGSKDIEQKRIIYLGIICKEF